MLDFFTVFTHGGLILWYFQSTFDYKDKINRFIDKVLIEEKLDKNIYRDGDYSIEFLVNNDKKLNYIAGYRTFLQINYAIDLIKEFKGYFENLYTKKDYKSFSKYNDQLNEYFDTLMKQSTNNSFNYLTMATNDEVNSSENIEKIHISAPTKRENNKIVNINNPKIKNASKKSARKWELDYNQNDEVTFELDYSDDKNFSKNKNHLNNTKLDSMKGNLKPLMNSPTENNSNNRKMVNFFKNLLMGKELTKEHILPSLEKMKENLYTKNVAKEVVDQISQSILIKLEGTKQQSFQGLNSILQKCLEESLQKILTPTKNINILDEIFNEKQNKKLYTIVFCGVNGVGKSTNLAKICYWLLENNLNVLVAACDTFRSGAVEQLRTHVQRFVDIFQSDSKCNLFDKGYGKDASVVASEAIKFAKNNHHDVLLIDTAGRMQDNEPLMRSLSKLIHDNQPNLVLFVGEALVGNEAVDQLVKFNQSLQQFSINSNPHSIDGIILTKFDTVDDKVGAALSMSYISGKPIVFVGTGQSYSDLRSFNGESIIKSNIILDYLPIYNKLSF